MRFAVVGHGAIGGLFAARLAKAGHEVCIVERGNNRKIPEVDAILICVKAYDTAAAARRISGTKAAAVVSLQNGLGNAEVLARFVGKRRVIVAATAQAAYRDRKGRLRHTGEGVTWVAPMNGSARGRKICRRIAAAFRCAGLPARVHPDARRVLWSKLILNAAINPLAALTGLPNGELIRRPALREILEAAAREAAEIARREGIRPLYPDAAQKAREACRATARNLNSMLLDLRAGKPTELEWITGVLLEHAGRTGVPAPVNRTLYKMVLEKTRRSR